MKKCELFALLIVLLMYCDCCVLLLFPTVPSLDPLCVIVVCPGHAHLPLGSNKVQHFVRPDLGPNVLLDAHSNLSRNRIRLCKSIKVLQHDYIEKGL